MGWHRAVAGWVVQEAAGRGKGERGRTGVLWPAVLRPQERGGRPRPPALSFPEVGLGGVPGGKPGWPWLPVWDGAHRRQSRGQGPGRAWRGSSSSVLSRAAGQTAVLHWVSVGVGGVDGGGGAGGPPLRPRGCSWPCRWPSYPSCGVATGVPVARLQVDMTGQGSSRAQSPCFREAVFDSPCVKRVRAVYAGGGAELCPLDSSLPTAWGGPHADGDLGLTRE